MDNYVYNMCSLCFNRSYGNDTSLTKTRCFSTEEHVNSEQIQVVVRHDGRLISPQDQQNNTYGYFGGYPAMPQNQYYYPHQMAYYQQMYRYPHPSQVYPHRSQVYLNEPIRHNYPQGYPRPPNHRSYVKPVVNNVMQGSHEERKLNPPPLSDAKLPLTVECYQRKFRALLYYEEEEHVSLLAKNCNGCYPISIVTNTEQFRHKGTEYDYYFCIHGLSPSQILYASQASGEVHVICSSSQYRHIKAKIIMNYDHSNDMLHIGVDSMNGMRLCETITSVQQSFQMKFEVKHSYFNRLHQSLNQITKEALKRIIPSDEDYKEGLDPIPVIAFPDDKLDVFQCNALKTMAFSRCTAPVLIPGPFGSGKTRLLSVASEYLNAIAKSQSKRCRILLCCCQQDSADIFMRDYFLKMLRNGWNVEVVRIVSFLHKRGPASQYVKTLDQLKQEIHRYLSVDHLVVITTFMTSLNLPDVFPQEFFTHILIDEGAQAREPECIAPLCMANKNTRIIIAGDSKQVGPKLLVLGEIPQKWGLGESLLERLYISYKKIAKAKRYSVLLCNNYRCASAILELPSTLFYQSSLIPCARLNPIRQYPLGFICSSASRAAMAFCEDEVEAKIIVQEVENVISKHGITPNRICIMSPSQRQISLIRNLIRHKGNYQIKLFSTYQMQGQEFDVLLLSTVESVLSNGRPFDPLKSLCHPTVFNTAITRARSLVIAVGNPSTLINSEEVMGSSFGCWKKFISKCKNFKTYDGTRFRQFSQPVIKSTDDLSSHYVGRNKPLHSQGLSSQSPYVDMSYNLNPRHRRGRPNFVWSTSEVSNDTSTKRIDDVKSVPTVKPNQRQMTTVNPYQTSSKNLSCVQKSNDKPRDTSRQTLPHSTPKKQSSSTQPQRNIVSHTKIQRGKSEIIPNKRAREEYEKQFPSLGDSKKVPNKAVKAMKWMEKEIVRESEFGHNHRPVNKELLDEELTRNNYKEKFHQLLCREEEEHDKLLKQRCDGIYDFYIYQRGLKNPENACSRDARDYHVRFGYITADHLDGDKIAYALQASEGKVYINFQSSNSDITEMRLDIVGTKFNKIFLGLQASDESKVASHSKNEIVKVTFILKYSYFDRLHQGIDSVSSEIIEKLLPTPSDFSPMETQRPDIPMLHMVRDFVSLDGPQIFALNTILQANPCKAPVLIAGSFGTGKTRLLARAAYQILHNNRNTAKVLICAHHQASVDSFVENYFGKMIDNGWKCDIVRLTPMKFYKAPENYAQYYKTPKEMKRIPKDRIKLVLTTHSSSHQLSYLGKEHFTHILLDEGAQTREPETIIPFCVANKNTTIVIAGDHKQVGPSILVLGKEARNNGLKISLLERLHKLYSEKELFVASEPHCIALLTNFRSHHALLSLPSYLFYGSALATKAKSTTERHPDFLHPLQFICSSLNDDIVQVNESVNEKEAIMILDKVREYVSKWPTVEWGEKNQNGICVMATTANQKNLILQRMRKAYKDIGNVEVKTVYDIQGSEFRVIFLSTAEPIDENGMSINPTKSPCGQYVFNTAITRAKSLVVCAGNPFLLMKVEDKMEKVDTDKSFWKDYFRRCIITRSFIVPLTNSNTTELIDRIQKLVFTSKEGGISDSDFHQYKLEDSIIKRLEKLVAERRNIKECTIEIKQQQNESQNWQIDQDSSTQAKGEIDNGCQTVLETIICELQVKNRREAIAIPQKSQKDSIIINGFHNRQGAFDGDLVEISVYGKDDDGQRYGRVTNIVKFQHSIKYVCEADKQSIICFYPIDKNIPGIVNIPKVTKRILQYKPEEFGKVQKAYIAVFEESSLNVDGDLSLKIKELIPMELAPSLLFVVKVLSWSPRYRKPLGAVIEALPRTNNLFITEKLFLIAHDIQQDNRDHYPKDECEASLNDDQGPLKIYAGALTIDPPTTINRDDAVTIDAVDGKPNTYELAVLIIDVAKYIKKDSKLDEIAKNRCTSVYGGQLKHQIQSCAIHMLPSGFSTNKLSLNENEDIKPVIAVSAEVTIKEDEVIEVKTGIPKQASLQSPINLSYHTSQCILNGQNVEGQTPERRNKIKKKLELLLKVAMKIRVDRLHDAAYSYPVLDPDEIENWQSHLMVEELMIWANSHVAQYMIKECSEPPSDFAVLRCQAPPLAKELTDLRNAYKDVLGYSLCHKSLSLSEDVEGRSAGGDLPIVITSQTIQQLIQAYKNNNLAKISRILSLESNFPQLAMIESAIISISQSAKYVCAKNMPENPEYDTLGHYSLQCRYTHFSSPIRRYFDIIVQRILKALIEKKEMPYSSSELEELCRIINLKTKNAKRYGKDMDRAQMASYWEDEGMEKATAYVACFLQKRQKLYLCFPFGQFSEFMKRDDTSFDFSQLNYYKREQNVITWKVLSVPLSNSDYLIKCPQLQESKAHGKENSAIQLSAYPHVDCDEGSQAVEADENGINRRNVEHSLAIKDDNIAMQLETWKLAQNCVKTPNEENIENFMSELLPSSERGNLEALSKDTIANITDSPLIRYTATTRFGEGSLVNCWISKSLRKPINSPNLHLIEVAPTVKICLQHIKDPTTCFSGIQLQLSSCRQYKSEKEYVDQWSKILLAEASVDGVKTKEIILLKDAPLQWPKLVRKEISIDKAYFECDEYLTLKICLEKFDMMDLVGIQSGDLVCARYEVSDSNGKLTNEVYHFYVKSAEEENVEVESEEKDELTILLGSYGEHGCRVSQKMCKILNKSKPLCDLQIMKMPISFNRLFKRLQTLIRKAEDCDANVNAKDKKKIKFRDDWMPLAIDVALGNRYYLEKSPDLMNEYYNVYNNNVLATSLWDPTTNERLNQVQLQAIESALKHKFQLIQGPPGTGKSITGAHLAFIFAKSNKKVKKGQCVLYCGPSNKAVDVVHNQLVELNKRPNMTNNKLSILRLYGRTHERKDYPDPIMEATRVHHFDEKVDSMCPEKFKIYALHHKIRESGSELKKMEDEIRKTFHKNKQIPSAKQRKQLQKLLQVCEGKELKKSYDIILCTCNETCSGRLLSALQTIESLEKLPLIAQCIVDECGMATEPETLAAISKCQHAVLIGDHKQLQPVVKYQVAKDAGLCKSLFERYAEENINLITLETQYRMHPFICKGPSEIFYDGKLEASDSVKKRNPLGNLDSFWHCGRYPIMVYDIEGKEESGLTSQNTHMTSVDAHSKYNTVEAEKTVSVIKILTKKHSIHQSSIAVMTPYAAQKNKIGQLLKAQGMNEVSVLSVIESQGDEYDVVILSTVRSQKRTQIEHKEYIQPDERWKKDNLGFLIDPHQVNVAITRAKYGLIIIGNRTLLCYDETWEELIEKYDNAKCIEIIKST